MHRKKRANDTNETYTTTAAARARVEFLGNAARFWNEYDFT